VRKTYKIRPCSNPDCNENVMACVTMNEESRCKVCDTVWVPSETVSESAYHISKYNIPKVDGGFKEIIAKVKQAHPLHNLPNY
jgi:hypothetical protein